MDCLAPPPTVKHTGQESVGELQNFRILIVSAVKICKQCLQTDSACGDPSAIAPQMKIPRAATAKQVMLSPVSVHPSVSPLARLC